MQTKELQLTQLTTAAKGVYKQINEALRLDLDYIVIEADGGGMFLASLLTAKLPKVKGIKTVAEVIANRRNLAKRKLLFVTDLLTDKSFAKITLDEFQNSCIAALFGVGTMRDVWRFDARVFVGGKYLSSYTKDDFNRLWRSKL